MLELIAIGSLMAAITSVWCRPTFLWLAPFLLFLVTGLLSGWIAPIALTWMVMLAAAVWFQRRASTQRVRDLALGLLIVIALLFGTHLMPGFETLYLLENVRLSDRSGWSALRFTADKPLVGLFLLVCWRDRLCSNAGEWLAALMTVALPILVGVAGVFAVAVSVGHVAVDFSPAAVVFVWFLRNLLLTVVAEEMLFRQVMQTRLEAAMGGETYRWRVVLAISVLFGIVHLYGGWQYGLLAAMAAAVYGYVYARSRRVEMAMLAHIALNAAHVLFFTYPSL